MSLWPVRLPESAHREHVRFLASAARSRLSPASHTHGPQNNRHLWLLGAPSPINAAMPAVLKLHESRPQPPAVAHQPLSWSVGFASVPEWPLAPLARPLSGLGECGVGADAVRLPATLAEPRRWMSGGPDSSQDSEGHHARRVRDHTCFRVASLPYAKRAFLACLKVLDTAQRTPEAPTLST